MSGDFNGFLRIREQYARTLPQWMADYEETGRMHNDPYIFDWLRLFTPIEESVWGDIRCSGIPFYPQIPVLNYFIDFGCPFLKIGIECDGKAWHNKEADAIRDARLAEVGWTIFRIEGHECKRVLPQPWEEDQYEEPHLEDVYAWFMTTSEGVIHAIKARYFDDSMSDFNRKHSGIINSTLFEHNATPHVVVPMRRPIVSTCRPVA